MTDYPKHREAVVASLERSCKNDPQRQLNSMCGYVVVGGALELKTAIYGLCTDELKRPNCTMVLVHSEPFGFYWIRHRNESIRMGAEANLYIRQYHRRYMAACEPAMAALRIDKGFYIPPQEVYLLERYA